MRGCISVAFLFVVGVFSPSLAQDSQKAIEPAVVVPKENVLLVVAHQPECPLKIEHIELHAPVAGGHYPPDLKLRHKGDIPIKSFKVAYIDAEGTGGSWTFSKKLVLPNQVVTVSEKPPSVKIIPLTEELRKQLRLTNVLQGLIIIVVVRVDFTDETFYEDEKSYESLRRYFEDRPSHK
ncbi:MAG: hypothetical protein JNJ50_18575 [Acidobacteria bacterium]|nr:hypothetical protein [Acidobacteriota bacterium]